MKTEIEILLECLIDEIKSSGDPSEKTLEVLSRYKDEYDFVKKYLDEIFE
ncbi:MAG: hypothetical protein H0Z24_03255 [Thermosipho sp. (in: Bacteria)]|nr:hypothetical protein [Thermosipho sp. (in: thermotogales)]